MKRVKIITEVYYRSLKELRLSSSDKFKTLICDYTLLEKLPVEGFSNLERYVGVSVNNGVDELNFCQNPKITDLRVTSKNLTRVTVPSGIRSENIKVQSLANVVVNRCQ